MSASEHKVAAVIVAYGRSEYLERVLSSWRRACTAAGVEWRGTVVLAAGDEATRAVAERSPGVGMLAVQQGEIATPGANRNRGAQAVAAELLLFLDGDMELDETFLQRGLRFLSESPRCAGFGGRIDERHWRDGREVGGSSDLYRVGPGGDVAYLAQAWLCRRAAFEQVGGFDARLPSEEDFELGLRLRAAGWTLRAEPRTAAMHHCAPRPSFAEFGRRWRNGMYAGQGLVLRYAWGRRGFAELLGRQKLYVAALLFLGLALPVAIAAVAGEPRPLLVWLTLALAAWVGMWLRKGSARLAAMSLLTWAVQGVALARAWIFGSWGPHAAPPEQIRRAS